MRVASLACDADFWCRLSCFCCTERLLALRLVEELERRVFFKAFGRPAELMQATRVRETDSNRVLELPAGTILPRVAPVEVVSGGLVPPVNLDTAGKSVPRHLKSDGP